MNWTQFDMNWNPYLSFDFISVLKENQLNVDSGKLKSFQSRIFWSLKGKLIESRLASIDILELIILSTDLVPPKLTP